MADDTDIQQICGICHRQFARYTCPRCNLRYCSMNCYKAEAHLDCTESFYKESIQNEIHAKGATQADRHDMMAMLQRFEQEAAAREEKGGDLSFADTNVDLPEEDPTENSPNGDATSSLEGRLKKLDLENASTDQILSILTVEERDQFEKSLFQDGELEAEVPLWEPWWLLSNRNIDEGNDRRPSVPSDVVEFVTLTSTPHPTLPYNLLNLLYGYVFVCRSMNGDIHENAHEAWNMFSQTGSVFDPKSTAHFKSCKAAIEDVIIRSNNTAFSQPSALHDLLINDMHYILRGPQDVLAAVSDLHTLLASIKRDKKASLASKKMAFYLSFVKWWSEESSITLGKQLISRSALLVELIHYQSERSAYDTQFERAKAQIEDFRRPLTPNGKSAPQIQELD